jgi:streptomycin 6-kinase
VGCPLPWGLRLTVLVDEPDADVVATVDRLLDAELPDTFAGHPVRFPTTYDPRLRHKVEVATLATFARSRLGVDPTRSLTALDWLSVTGQAVLEITAGPVLADPTGALDRTRSRLRWYPDAVWHHVLAAGWHRVGQELALVGRTGERGDDTGSRIIAARLACDLRHLCFLVERRWAPYPKWAGTAFADLALATTTGPALTRALRANAWQDRQAALADAADAILAAQAAAGLPAPGPATHAFFDRPALAVNPEVATALRSATTDRVELDVPDDVRKTAVADGNEAWLDGLESALGSLARDWSLTLGESLRGGHDALVVATTNADGTASVLKVGIPGHRRRLGFEAAALELAAGQGCARLLRQDLNRNALLLERLGCAMYDVIPDPATRHDELCDLARELWRPLGDDIDLPTGAHLARRLRDAIPRLWEGLGRPCARQTIDDAIACAANRERAHDRRRCVLVHGDVHDANALQDVDGTFKLIDPDGLRAEPACDLGTIVRCNPCSGDDLRARAQRLAARTGLDATAIWEWGTVHRVIGGLHSTRVGFQPFGRLLLAEADRLRGTT